MTFWLFIVTITPAGTLDVGEGRHFAEFSTLQECLSVGQMAARRIYLEAGEMAFPVCQAMIPLQPGV